MMFSLEEKLIALLLSVLVLAGAGWALHAHGVSQGEVIERITWQKKEVARQQAEQAAILARVAENNQTRKDQEAINRSVIDEYEKQIADLKHAAAADRAASDRAGGLRITRAVCDFPPTPTKTTSAGRADESSAATIRLPQPLESELWNAADDADAVSAQLRALQVWIRQNGFYGEPLQGGS